jgi:hypothetical protein
VSPVLGQNVTLTAAITPESTGTAAPSGTVEFFDGSTLLGSGTVSSDVATLITTALPVDTSSITATYEGDGNYTGSTSPGDSVTVVQSATPPSPPFQLMTSPTINGSLSGVSAVSPTDIWAVGSGPNPASTTLAEHFNGTSWSVVATPNPAGSTFTQLNAVSALSSNAVWAVGDSSSGPVVEFFNGTSWSIQTTPTIAGGGGVLNAVTALSPTNVWAVGSTSLGSGTGYLIEHFDGTSWSISLSTSANRASLTGISAVSPTDIFAIGSTKNTGAQLLHFDGTTWSTLPTPSTGIPDRAIDAISDSDIWVVGSSGGTANFNGTAWTQIPDAVGGDLVSIAGTSANDLFAVGETISTTDQPLVEQWNGTSWSVVTSANPSTGANSFSGVTTLSNGTAVAVGTVGIESNATTASPASSVSGILANSLITPSATSPVQAPGSIVSPNGIITPPATSPVQAPGSIVSPNRALAPPQTSPVQVTGSDVLDVLQSLRRRRDHLDRG